MSEGSSGYAPGWYHAEGDPPGTQRYWNGSQWVGSPQAVGGTPAPASYQAVAGGGAQVGSFGPPASIGSRFVALLIDGAIGFAIMLVSIIVFFVGLAGGDALALLGLLVFAVGMLASIGFAIWNQVLRQGRTGQTIGKQRQGIRLVADATGQPVGAGSAFIRLLLGGAINSVCAIDMLWPLFDPDRKRLSDKILNFSVLVA